MSAAKKQLRLHAVSVSTARNRDQPIQYYLWYWIGCYENYQGQFSSPSGPVDDDQPRLTVSGHSLQTKKVPAKTAGTLQGY